MAVASDHQRSAGRYALVVVALIVSVLVVLVLGAAAWLHVRLTAGLERFPDPFVGPSDRPVAAAPATAGAPVNILLLGTDSRTSNGDPGRWTVGAQRTDTIVLVHVSADREGVHVLSLPRDTWVDIPRHGERKLNAAYSLGGPALAVETVEQLTGVPIDHVAVADFTAFAAITDAVGGVELTVDQAVPMGNRALEPGTRTLTGAEALAYVHQRYGVEGGDLTRIERQQAWLRAVADRLGDALRADPGSAVDLLETTLGHVAVDETFSSTEMVKLAVSMRAIRAEDITFLTAPVAGLGRSPDGRQSIVDLDDARFADLTRAFADDTVAEHLASQAS